eukprot:356968-Chlamydomonas_euryale.AAC.30
MSPRGEARQAWPRGGVRPGSPYALPRAPKSFRLVHTHLDLRGRAGVRVAEQLHGAVRNEFSRSIQTRPDQTRASVDRVEHVFEGCPWRVASSASRVTQNCASPAPLAARKPCCSSSKTSPTLSCA